MGNLDGPQLLAAISRVSAVNVLTLGRNVYLRCLDSGLADPLLMTLYLRYRMLNRTAPAITSVLQPARVISELVISPEHTFRPHMTSGKHHDPNLRAHLSALQRVKAQGELSTPPKIVLCR